MRRVIKPEAGEDLWSSTERISVLRLAKVIRIMKIIRPEGEECVRTADLTQEKVKPSPDRRSST